MLKLIIGKRGRGKTTLAMNFILSGQYDQTFILDFCGEYEDLRSDKIYISYEEINDFYNRIRDNTDEVKKTLVVLDEIDLYGTHSIAIKYLYRYGRHANCDLIAISRRFYEMPVIVRGLTDEFYLFQITDESDLKYLRHYAPKEKILKLITLEHFKYMTIKFN